MTESGAVTHTEAPPPPRAVVTRARHLLQVYWSLPAIAFGGLLLRFAMVLWARPECPDTNFTAGAGFPPSASLDPPRCLRLTGDSLFNYMQGKMIAEGKGYGNGFAYLDSGRVIPSAGKPPLFPAYLALLHKLGLQTVDQQRLGTSLLGAVGIVLLGLLAWRLAGRRAGIIAAVIAALSPLLWINDGRMMVESMYAPLVAGVLLAAYRFFRVPGLASAVLLGGVLALATLARSEASQLFVWLLVPLAFSIPRMSLKNRAVLVGVAGATGIAILMPWVIRNLTTFQEPIYLQTGSGLAFLNGQCDAAYYSEDALGMEHFDCFTGDAAPYVQQLIRPEALDESEIDSRMRTMGTEYLLDHLDRVPMMIVYREGRVWELYQPFDNVNKNYRLEDRGQVESALALVAYAITMPLAAYGLVVLRRRRVTIIPFMALVALVTITVAATFGIIRFRLAVDVAAVALAAVAIDALVTKYGRPATDDDGRWVLPAPRPWRRRDRAAPTAASG